MADDWDEDWDEADVPQLPQLSGVAAPKVEDKFAGEDEGEEEPKYVVPKTQESKKPAKPTYEDKGAVEDDTPLDDPVAEKLRKQRLVEAADLKNAQELFGADINLDKLQPKSAKEFENYGKAVALKYLTEHDGSTHFKSLLKALLKTAMNKLSVQETKDIETMVAGIRSDKVKAEAKEKASATKGGKKKNLNVGSKGGSAGLDDYVYDEAGDGDDFDFM